MAERDVAKSAVDLRSNQQQVRSPPPRITAVCFRPPGCRSPHQDAARQAQNVELERQACEIRLRAERRVEQLLKVMEKAEGGRPTEKTPAVASGVSSLADLGVSHKQSSQWQKLAKVAEQEFVACKAAGFWCFDLSTN